MAETTDYQASAYPLPAYNFRVTLDGTAMSFSEVSGIAIEFETVKYKHGLSFSEGETIKKFYYDKYVPITLKKGTVHGINSLHEWLQTKELKPIDVSLCDQNGVPVVTWHIRKAIPTKLTAPTFDAGTNEVSIESLEVMTAGVSVEHHK